MGVFLLDGDQRSCGEGRRRGHHDTFAGTQARDHFETIAIGATKTDSAAFNGGAGHDKHDGLFTVLLHGIFGDQGYRLCGGNGGIPGLALPHIPKGNTHVYYSYMLKVDEQELGISRAALVKALQKRGFPIGAGYERPLYLLPLFQKRQAFNKTHFPFDYQGMRQDYSRGSCPVTERMHYRELVGTDVCQHPYTAAHVDAFAAALREEIAAANKK